MGAYAYLEFPPLLGHDPACARALHFQAFSYRNVKTILDKGLDAEGVSQIPKPVADHANVRGADYYKEAGPCAN